MHMETVRNTDYSSIPDRTDDLLIYQFSDRLDLLQHIQPCQLFLKNQKTDIQVQNNHHSLFQSFHPRHISTSLQSLQRRPCSNNVLFIFLPILSLFGKRLQSYQDYQPYSVQTKQQWLATST